MAASKEPVEKVTQVMDTRKALILLGFPLKQKLEELSMQGMSELFK